VEENFKIVDMRQMIYEDFEGKLVGLRVELSNLKILLREKGYGWITEKKKVTCHSLQVKLKKRLISKLEKELIEIEFKMEAHHCELC